VEEWYYRKGKEWQKRYICSGLVLGSTTTMPAHPTTHIIAFLFLPFVILFFLRQSRRSLSILAMYTPVAILAVLAILAAILGLISNTLHAQQVVHALLAATTGAVILHLLDLASRPKFKLYAYFVLPIILLFCGTFLSTFLYFY
jgi:VIT1/CCC1 family predicted Fe2+/Mn2+ transporter